MKELLSLVPFGKETYFEDRESFIKVALENGVSATQVAWCLEISPNTIFSIQRYGKTGRWMLDTEKREFKKARKNRCENCGKGGLLHIHHKDSPRDNSWENLALLCPKCHRHEDMKKVRRGSKK